MLSWGWKTCKDQN